jgi:hypothetical protein
VAVMMVGCRVVPAGEPSRVKATVEGELKRKKNGALRGLMSFTIDSAV